MNSNDVTVSEISALIQAREDTLAELLNVYEHWLELEARIRDVEVSYARANGEPACYFSKTWAAARP